MSAVAKLAGKGNKLAARVLDAFNPDQERDERGRWGGGGPGSNASTSASTKANAESAKVGVVQMYSSTWHADKATSHATAAQEHHANGEHEVAKAHEEAAKLHTLASHAQAATASYVTQRFTPENYKASAKAGAATRNADLSSAKADRASVRVGSNRRYGTAEHKK